MTKPVEQRLRRTVALMMLAISLDVVWVGFVRQLMAPGLGRFFVAWFGGMAAFAICYLLDRRP